MAAPSNTIWGSIRGSGERQGRIGIYYSVSDTATTRTVNIGIWLWTRYRCNDSSNTFKYGWSSSPGTTIGAKHINTPSNSSWNTSNQVAIATYSKAYTKGTSNTTGNASASYSNVEYAGGSGSVAVSFTIPALAKYTISYNANGGTGAPGSQTKWYGKNVTISTTKPTRNGYSFQGWATSSSGGVSYGSGASYSGNANLTLYAVWNANTFTVSYDANGGTGAPGKQTKTYGVNLTLSSVKPTRANYNFRGWGTSPGASTVSYNAGGIYKNDSSITLYAIWGLAYTAPRITDYVVDRCDSYGNVTESGTYAKVSFSWETDKPVSAINIEYKQEMTTSWSSVSVTASGTIGSVSRVIGGSMSTDHAYNIRVTVTDTNGSSNSTKSIGAMSYTIDLLAGGKGVAFGKPATRAGIIDSAFIPNFSPSLIGGENIADYTDLNTIKMVGNYACYDTTAKTLSNCPSDRGFHMEVGYAYDNNAYIYQEITGGLSAITWYRRCCIETDAWSEWRTRPTISTISSSTDLNGLTIPGVYYTRGSSGGNPNLPTTMGQSTFVLEVLPMGTDFDQIVQRLTRCDKETPSVYERVYHSGSWGNWETISNGGTKILWSGGYYMTAGHTATLKERISAQAHGIILVFTPYMDGVLKDFDRNTFFIPKEIVARHNGKSIFCTSGCSMPGNVVANKCLMVFDDRITGHADNTFVGKSAGSGIYLQSNKFVLQYVIGV